MRSRSQGANCRVCDGEATELGRTRILGRHWVGLWECGRCGFRQTDEPWWLEEAYRDPINVSDTGVVDRVLWSAVVVKCLVGLAFDRRRRLLDVGGGYGLFVRHMRDLGLDFRWEDKFCSNLLARGFESSPGETGFALATAFEVAEHVIDPLEWFSELLGRADALLFCTQLAPEDPAEFLRWPYLAPEHGQHIGFFRMQTLRWLAHSMGVQLLSNGSNLHLLSRRPIARWKFTCAAHARLARWAGKLFTWPSLTLPDHEQGKHALRAGSESE